MERSAYANEMCIKVVLGSAYVKNWKYPKYPSKRLMSVSMMRSFQNSNVYSLLVTLFLAPLKIRV